MCKLLIMTGITEPVLAKLFMQNMAVPMSKRNNHGIGYAAVDSNGQLFSEKWQYNFSFMDYETIMVPSIAKKLLPFKNRLPAGALDTTYLSYGNNKLDDIRSVIMHTRFATCDINISNTHPFIYNDTALVHNGVLRNSDIATVNKISTCDSEYALQKYLEKSIDKDTSGAKSWANALIGSFAFGILGLDSNNARILDVVRGSSFLYEFEVEGLGKCFTTDNDDAKEVVKNMGLTFIKEPTLVTYDSMFRFNAVTGELIEEVPIRVVIPTTTNYYSGNRSTTYYSGETFGDDDLQCGWSSSRDSKADGNKSTTGSQYEAGPTTEQQYAFSEFITSKGDWDYHKVSKYNNDTDEPISDRLYVFDAVFGTNLLNVFESVLDEEQKSYVEMVDFRDGFKYARKEIKSILKFYKKTNLV